MTRSLNGKVALVTGAAKGIGAGIAKAMAAAGASVVVNFASDRPGAERVVADIKAAGGNAFAAQANVSVVAEVEHLLPKLSRRSGRSTSSSTMRACSRSPCSSRRPTSNSTRCWTSICGARLSRAAKQ